MQTARRYDPRQDAKFHVSIVTESGLTFQVEAKVTRVSEGRVNSGTSTSATLHHHGAHFSRRVSCVNLEG